VGQRPGFANTSEARENAVGAIAANGVAAAGRALATSLRAASAAPCTSFLEQRCRICAHSRVAWTKTHRLVRRVPHGLVRATASLQ